MSANNIVRVDARNSIGNVSNPSTGGSIGTIQAPSIGGVTARGNLTAVIVENWDTGNAAEDYVNTISATGNITTVSVTGIPSTPAALRGNVMTDLGSIGTITSTVQIGPASGTPSTIRAKTGITTISAPTINANITANYLGGTGAILTMTASTGDFTGSLSAATIGTATIGNGVIVNGVTNAVVSVPGNVNMQLRFNGGITGGSVTVGNVLDVLRFGGASLGAPVTINSVLAGGSVRISGDLPSNQTVTINTSMGGAVPTFGDMTVLGNLAGRLWIGGSLTGPLTIGTVGTAPLPGQVIIGRNHTTPIPVWTGTVTVAGTVLSPLPAYTQIGIGSGAVGLVPFRVHPQMSNITRGGYYFRPGSGTYALPSSILIRHYGPFTLANSPRVEMRDPYSGSWSDVSLMFSISRDAADAAHRTLKVVYTGCTGTPMPIAVGHYKVVVAEDDLLCEDLFPTAGDVSLTPYEYEFNVTIDCSGNSMPDVGDFLTSPGTVDCDLNGFDDACDWTFDHAFRDVVPSPDGNHVLDICEITCPCDFNHDYFVNSQDFFDFLTCFFT